MEQIAISKFKATCLAVLERVRKTGKPVSVTRFGKPVAEIIPPAASPRPKSWLGSMAGTLNILGDIVSPVTDGVDWAALNDETTIGYAHLDMEPKSAGKAQPKRRRSPRKFRQ